MVNMEEFPLLVYDTDECGIGKSALMYAEQKHDIMLLDFSDVFHGECNDVKKEAQNDGGEMWRSILQMTHCINMPSHFKWGKTGQDADAVAEDPYFYMPVVKTLHPFASRTPPVTEIARIRAILKSRYSEKKGRWKQNV